MTWTLDKWKFLRENAATMTRRELAEAMGVSKASISQQCLILDIKTRKAERRRMMPEPAEQPEPVQPPAPQPEKRKLRPSKYRSAQEERPYEFVK